MVLKKPKQLGDQETVIDTSCNSFSPLIRNATDYVNTLVHSRDCANKPWIQGLRRQSLDCANPCFAHNIYTNSDDNMGPLLCDQNQRCSGSSTQTMHLFGTLTHF